MVKNDPKVIAKLLRAAAGGTDAKASQHDIIFNAAADLLDPPPSETEPLFYVRGFTIFHRPVRTAKGARMGFRVCEVGDGCDPDEVCALLNRAEPATE